MIVEETSNGDVEHNSPLERGVAMFPENENEIKYIDFILKNIELYKTFYNEKFLTNYKDE